MKKFISLVLALVMALSLTTVAFGAVTDKAGLQAAITNAGSTETTIEIGANVTIDMVGITFPANAKITFQSADAANPATLDFSSQGYNQYLNGNGGTFTFKNLNVKRATGIYTGLAHSAAETYVGCNITGLFFGYSPTVSFTDCSFNSNGAEHCVWTYSADMSFTNCDFTYTDRAVNAYSDQGADASVISFDNCTFTKATTGATTSAGAIEINSSIMTSVDLSVEDTTVSEGELWWVSGWDSDYGSDTSVKEDGVEYAAAEVNGVKYITLGAAIQAANDGDTITLLDDIALVDGQGSIAGALTIDKDVTIDLAGHDIASAAGSSAGVKATADLTIEDSVGGSSVSVPLAEDTANGGDITITGGSYTDDVSDYLAAGVELDNGVVVPKGGASVTAKAYKMTSNGTLVPGDVNAIYAPAVAAVLNDDGKQTNTADISHYTFEGVNCVVATSLADADFVLYSDAAGKNVMMYLKEAVTSYNGSGAVYANFGKACGQVTYTAEAGKTYYTTNADGDAGIYVADKEGTKALMVGGKLVLVKAAPVAYTTAAVKHAAVPTVKDGKVTGYTCATCKTVAVEAPNFMSIPKGAVQDGLPGNWYWPSAPVVTPSTDKVTSAETFDAGIAMYVGMSVMAAAGSAVVLKKKY